MFQKKKKGKGGENDSLGRKIRKQQKIVLRNGLEWRLSVYRLPPPGGLAHRAEVWYLINLDEVTFRTD